MLKCSANYITDTEKKKNNKTSEDVMEHLISIASASWHSAPSIHHAEAILSQSSEMKSNLDGPFLDVVIIKRQHVHQRILFQSKCVNWVVR